MHEHLDTLSDIKLIEFDVVLFEEVKAPFSFAHFLVSFEDRVVLLLLEEVVRLRLLLSFSLES